jgi:hypothetical protein
MTVRLGPEEAYNSERSTPWSATNSRRGASACSASLHTVNERRTLQPVAGSRPTTTRTSNTPGERSRSDPSHLAPANDTLNGLKLPCLQRRPHPYTYDAIPYSYKDPIGTATHRPGRPPHPGRRSTRKNYPARSEGLEPPTF